VLPVHDIKEVLPCEINNSNIPIKYYFQALSSITLIFEEFMFVLKQVF